MTLLAYPRSINLKTALLKSALRFVGISPPRQHDPGPVLMRHLERFPPRWKERAAEIRALSERLFAERGHAFNGDEDDLLPPSELFERSEAEKLIAAVERVLARYREILESGKT